MIKFPTSIKKLWFIKTFLLFLCLVFVAGGIYALNKHIGSMLFIIEGILYVVSFFVIVFYYKHLKYKIDGFQISISCNNLFGFYTKTFAKSTIHQYKIKQSPLERLFKLYTVSFYVFSKKEKLRHIDMDILQTLSTYHYIKDELFL